MQKARQPQTAAAPAAAASPTGATSSTAAAAAASDAVATAAPSKRTVDGRKKDFLAKSKHRQNVYVEELATSLRNAGSTTDAVGLVLGAVQSLKGEWPELQEALCTALAPAEQQESAPCSICSDLLSGLGSLGATVPGYDAPYPSKQLYEVRSAVDKMCRKALPDRSKLDSFGYKMGMSRWSAAALSADGPERKQRGRPSHVDNASNIKAVQGALEKYAQPSSEPCLNSKREWTEALILTKGKNRIFEDNDDLQGQMSARVFSNILKRHCCQFKAPRRLTDYCQICKDFDDQVLPQYRELVENCRAELLQQLPSYFEAIAEKLRRYGTPVR